MYGMRNTPYITVHLKGKSMKKEYVICDMCKKILTEGTLFNIAVWQNDAKYLKENGHLIKKLDLCGECLGKAFPGTVRNRENV